MTEQVDAALVAAMRSEVTDDTDLRNSLQEFGWLEELPAIQDEDGVTLVGNRRLRLAQELSIPPAVKVIAIGRGTEADARRFRLAYASNIGGKPMTPAERKKLAIYLTQTRNWTQQRIGEALGVGQREVHRYLEGVYAGRINPPPPRPQGGRPPGRRRTRHDPRTAPEEVQAAAASDVLDRGQTQTWTARERGITSHAVRQAVIVEEARRAAEPAVDRSSLPASHQRKLEILERRLRREADEEIRRRVEEAIVQRHEYMTQADLEVIRNADMVTSRTRGIMTPTQYRDLLRCLHADTHQNVSADLLNRSFQLITELKALLVREDRQSGALEQTLPRTMEDLLQRREEVRRQRQAARARAGGVSFVPTQ